MKAVLLAAGKGLRLAPVTQHLPKCLVPIHGKPLLGIWIEKLVKAGVSKIFINTHTHKEMVEAYVNVSAHRDSIRLFDEESLKGTGGTLWSLREFLRGEERFFLAHADNLSIFSFSEFMKFHSEHGQICTMMSFLTDRPKSSGILKTNSKGRVIKYTEKPMRPVGNLANAAVFIFSTDVFKFLSEEHKDLCRDVIPKLVHKGAVYSFFNEEFHKDIGTPDSLDLVQKVSFPEDWQAVPGLSDVFSDSQLRPLIDELQAMKSISYSFWKLS